ncbi:hypothetical protein ZYGR_0H00160 [Zygosaccharomyces rouxii]|uniref:ZYRO0B04356p n=2 Tax=Zygosaccharomyces rouxii TaxID=4956 RepID=C5DQZ8_ZYGRC|nr:uncharacterized protein ZYRO0B04356g [Zygosaccharomyces rouxii]KAH9200242.1 hypothetical protein LQ764DRAFT_225139 [Zygosaccharomyces rouxii]GAV47177.1 hypothetical protein ZYGR_0H00160 [Zygosaccharomyces rouxii]CAR26209.1 ZYRO0B04356p [Zygosaccharomyces rouxii]
MVELPLRFPELETLQNALPPNVLNQRENSVTSVNKLEGHLDFLARIDVLLDYSSSLCGILYHDDSSEILNQELIICLVDIAFFYREVSLDVMQGAYGSERTDGAWSTGGSYLRKGLGLLQFALNWILSSAAIADEQSMCSLVEDMIAELKLLQQIGIVVLSLSKLRTKMYKDQRDAVLDFQEQDLKDLAANSVLYSKLVIGCLDTALKCNRGTIINNSLFAYLNSLSFLLLSLDEYNKDETGVAIGMIERSVYYISKIVNKSQLSDPLLSRNRKRDRLKNALQKKPFHPGTGSSTVPWFRKDKDQNLLPLLQETLDDFLLPLIFLLRYRYRQTNDKVNFKSVEDEESNLRKLFPQGKAPDIQFENWSFDQRTCKLAPKPESSSGGRYY